MTIETFDMSQKEWTQSGEVQCQLPCNILEKRSLERHSKLRVTTFYSKNKRWVLKNSHESSKKIVEIFYDLYGSEDVAIEEYADGEFTRHVNNTGSDRNFVKEKQEKKPKLSFISHGTDRENIYVSYHLCDQKLRLLIFGLKRVTPKASFISAWETASFSQLRYSKTGN